MFCNDDAVTYLNHLGYNVVLTPREGFTPGQVLAGVKTALDRLGSLPDFVQGAPPLPPVQCDLEAPKITQKTSNKLGLDLGVNLLDRLLKAMGVGAGKIGSHYDKAANIELVFEDVLMDTLDPSAVGAYLGNAVPNVGNPWVAQLDRPGKAYIVTEIIKSDKFGVVAYGSDGETMDLDVKAIQKLVGAKAKVARLGSRKRELLYHGSRHLTFGFKAVEFWIEPQNIRSPFHLALPSAPIASKGLLPPPPSFVGALLGKNQLLELDGI